MIQEIKRLTGNVLETSVFLKNAARIKPGKNRSGLFGNAVRALTYDEIQRLETQGNRCPDWQSILVAHGFICDHVSESRFEGSCILGIFKGIPTEADPAFMLPSGIFRSILMDSEIGNDCLIINSCVSNYCISEKTTLFDVGSISCSAKCSFGNGRMISVGIESGGREIRGFAELTIQLAQVAVTQRSDRLLQDAYDDFVNAYIDACTLPFGCIGGESIIRHIAKVEDSCFGAGCIIDGATLIQNSTILSMPDEATEVSFGAMIRNSCVQWGCTATSMAIVDDSILTEYCRVERHAKVSHSIIGSNTVIAEGEVTSCMVGPFVGFHHQALLIAALWPEGKGNVGYGANVGSNHTSKAPDQELRCGEGIFFGLGVNIKFPADFSEAPYTIIASGVTTLPQRVEYPCSLIDKPSINIEGASPSFNEIVPGWVLSDNLYAVMRNEIKFKERNRAKRSNFNFDVLRPEIIDMIVRGRTRLQDISSEKKYYLPGDIAGIGKNFMSEESRLRGIDTYNFYIEYYCLCGLTARTSLLCETKANLASLYTETAIPPLWEHQRNLCAAEGFFKRSLHENLSRCAVMHEKVAADVQKAKAKDDVRGAAIIKDYAEAHVPALSDPFVNEIRKKTEEMKKEIERILSYVEIS